MDITHTDINKLALYASMRVPKFWRFNGQVWRIYQLQGEQYQEVEISPTFALVPKTKLYEFLAQAQEDEVAAEQSLRQCLQKQQGDLPNASACALRVRQAKLSAKRFSEQKLTL
ncbi:MAG: hypothetical protein ACREPR_16565 [Brasilonema sp.]